MKIITFKSTPENYHKEVSNIKPNTVRFTDDWNNERWKEYKFATHVCIEHKEENISFIEKIRDKTEYKNIIIISWIGNE